MVEGIRGDLIGAPAALNEQLMADANAQLASFSSNISELKGSVSPKANAAAVILAGGSGERFGSKNGKQLFPMLGRPVVTWTAMAFDAVPEIGQIVVVCPDERTDEFRAQAFDPYGFVTPLTMVPSGGFRQESALNGVQAVEERFELIAMHDGARPLVTPELIKHTLSVVLGTLDADGAVVGHPAIDTLKIVKGEAIAGTPERSLFWVAQTPQVFRSQVLRRAHMSALAEGFVGTDDSSLVERIGGKVLLVNGPRDNIKLTVPEDKGPIEAALRVRHGIV